MRGVLRVALITTVAASLLLPFTAAAQGAVAAPAQRTTVTQRSMRAHVAAREKLAASDPVALATTLAERYWGAVPCAGQLTVRAQQPLATGLEATTDGWATFESSLGANDLQAPASSYSQCVISLAAWQWPTHAVVAEDWNMFCLTLTHELGHLLGHPHSMTPDSVMAPIFTDESSVPGICRRARVEVEAAAGLLR
jgi:hypothetical protein